MEVTKLAIQAKNPNRVNLHVDGKFYRGLDKIVVMKLGLKQGVTLTPYLVKRLEGAQTKNSAWEYALRSLQRSGKSVEAMKRRLTERFDPEIADTTITKLLAGGILDDKKFALSIVRQHLEQGNKSKRQIIAKLKNKRVGDSIIQEAISTIGQTHEKAAALQAALYKNRQLKDADWRERFEKIGAYLARRGFRYETIREVVTPENLEVQKPT